jgi:hypothetical protein
MNNPLPLVLITLFLVALGLALGFASGVPEVVNIFGKDIHQENNMLMTATQRNLEATNDVIKSTQDYHAWVVTSTAMPLQQTSSVQNVQLVIAAMQNNATITAYEKKLQATASAEQFNILQTSSAQYGQSVVEAKKLKVTEDAIQLIADKEKYTFQLSQTQAVIDQVNEVKLKETEADNKNKQSVFMLMVAFVVAVSIILIIGVLGWMVLNFLRGVTIWKI